MQLSDVKLNVNLLNLNRKLPPDCMEVIEARESLPASPDSLQKPEIRLTALTTNGSRNYVKCPRNDENREQLAALSSQFKKTDGPVVVHLDTPKIRLYAMPTKEGGVLSGVSIKCDSFSIMESEEDDEQLF